MFRRLVPLAFLLLAMCVSTRAQKDPCPGCDCTYPPYTPECARCCIQAHQKELAANQVIQIPKVEVSMGYSYARFTPATGIEAVNINGGTGSLTVNVADSVGIVAEFGGYSLSNLTIPGFPAAKPDGALYTFLFGPRLVLAQRRVFSPFAQILFGGVHRTALTAQNMTIAKAENSIATTAGGGVDWNVRSAFAIRLAEIDYFATRFRDLSSATHPRTTQNSLRISAGIVFRIGQN